MRRPDIATVVKFDATRGWIIVGAVLLFLAALTARFASYQTRQSEAIFRATIANDLVSVATIIAEDLRRGESVAATDAVAQWATGKPEILSVRVTGADGYPIASFSHGDSRARVLTLAMTLPLSGRGVAHIALAKDLSPLDAAQNRLYIEIAALYLLVALFTALLMRALLPYRREVLLLRHQFEVSSSLEKQHDNDLRRNAQLAALVRHSREFVGIATLDGRGDFINEVGRKLVGMDPHVRVDTMTISDFVHAEEHQRLVQEILPALHTRGRWSGELNFRRFSDGAAIPMLVEAFHINDGLGNPQWLATVCLDITENKRLERAQRVSATHLATIIATEPDCVKLVGRDGRLLEMNAAGLTMLEAKSLDEACAYGLMNFICPEYRSDFAALHRRVIAGERGEMDFEVVGLDGARRWLHTSAAPMWDETRAETVLLGITSDITARKALEISVMAQAARNQLFLRTASDGVHIQNAAGKLIEVSESFCAMLGYKREELIGKEPSYWEARHATQDLRAAFSVLKSGNLKRFHTLHRRKDGSVFPVEVNTEHFDIAGAHYVYCAARDMSEQRRLEHALLNAMSTERQKLGRDMHDGLGQELSGISMLAATLVVSLNKAGRPEAGALQALAKLAGQAVENCRAIAHGLSPVVFADGGLVGLLHELVNLQRSSFGIDAQCSVFKEAPLRLESEAIEHLYRIAQEAITNARRHGQAKVIRIALEILPTTVRLEILDDGIGLQSSTVAPTGMGLKIMQVRAAIAGANLSIGSGDHGGTRVRCDCPQPSMSISAAG